MKQDTTQESDDTGATLVEYTLLVALIAVIAIAGITAFGQGVSKQYSDLNDALPFD